MTHLSRLAIPVAALVALATTTPAAEAFGGKQPRAGLEAHGRLCAGVLRLDVRARQENGETFALYAAPTTGASGAAAFDARLARAVTRHTAYDDLGSWHGSFEVDDPASLAGVGVVFRKVELRGTVPVGFTDVVVPFAGVLATQTLDFDFTIGPDEPVKGQVIDDEYAIAGITVSGINAAGGPNLAVIFDSANRSGGDTDLGTPGVGAGNDTALGKLLIVPENATDANADGLIDDPDDEAGGGTLRFTFADPVRITSATVVDIDDVGQSELRFQLSGGAIETIPIDNMGDNSVQTITFLKDGVVRMDVVLAGSGGLAGLDLIPCPLLINLDETPLGMPHDFQAGLEITDQFIDLGLTITGFNDVLGHPDKVILFDSENPTGGDSDLGTPGPGINNTTPLGFILIIAENDVDANMDGLVDDPDDEEGGGQMVFDFETDITFKGATVLDVDGTREDVFEFFDVNDMLLEAIQISALGDNSVQTLTNDPPIANVRRIVLTLGGSGAVTRLRWCPEL